MLTYILNYFSSVVPRSSRLLDDVLPAVDGRKRDPVLRAVHLPGPWADGQHELVVGDWCGWYRVRILPLS